MDVTPLVLVALMAVVITFALIVRLQAARDQRRLAALAAERKRLRENWVLHNRLAHEPAGIPLPVGGGAAGREAADALLATERPAA